MQFVNNFVVSRYEMSLSPKCRIANYYFGSMYVLTYHCGDFFNIWGCPHKVFLYMMPGSLLFVLSVNFSSASFARNLQVVVRESCCCREKNSRKTQPPQMALFFSFSGTVLDN